MNTTEVKSRGWVGRELTKPGVSKWLTQHFYRVPAQDLSNN